MEYVGRVGLNKAAGDIPVLECTGWGLDGVYVAGGRRDGAGRV